MSSNILSTLLFGLPSAEASLECPDGTHVDAILHHIHIQDFSSSFDDPDKIDNLTLGLKEVVAGLNEELNGEYNFSLIDSTDKPTIEKPDKNACAITKLESVSAEEALSSDHGIDFYLASVDEDTKKKNYWSNNQNPDLLDGIHQVRLQKYGSLTENDMIIFTVGTDQSFRESCNNDWPDEDGLVWEQGNIIPENRWHCTGAFKTDPDLFSSWQKDRLMPSDNCAERDYMGLPDLLDDMLALDSRVIWMIDKGSQNADVQAPDDQVKTGIKVGQFYEERVVKYLDAKGIVTDLTYTDSTDASDIAHNMIEAIKDAMCKETTPNPENPYTTTGEPSEEPSEQPSEQPSGENDEKESDNRAAIIGGTVAASVVAVGAIAGGVYFVGLPGASPPVDPGEIMNMPSTVDEQEINREFMTKNPFKDQKSLWL